MQFKQDSTVKRSDLSEFMAEVHFVSERNNLQIQSTTSKIDIVDEKPIQRLEDDQYEYIAHLRLRTDDGDMHYKKTFEVKIKGYNIDNYTHTFDGGRCYYYKLENVPSVHLKCDLEKQSHFQFARFKIPPQIPNESYQKLSMMEFKSVVDLKFLFFQEGVHVVNMTDSSSDDKHKFHYQVFFYPDSLEESGIFISTDGSIIRNIDNFGIAQYKSYIVDTVNLDNNSIDILESIQKQYVKLTVEPKNSYVSFNGKPLDVKNGKIVFELKEKGFYTCKVECANYVSKIDTIIVDKMDKPIERVIRLNKSLGTLLISGLENDTDSAVVFVDDELKGVIRGKQSYTNNEISSGTHNIKVFNPLYTLFDTMVSVPVGSTVSLKPEWKENHVDISVFCPDNDADIYINGYRMGGDNWNGKLPLGYYRFESRKRGCRPIPKDFNFETPLDIHVFQLPSPVPLIGFLQMDGKCRHAEVDVYRNDSLCFTQKLPVFLPLEVDSYSLVAKKNRNYNEKTFDNILISDSDTFKMFIDQEKVFHFFVEPLVSYDYSGDWAFGCSIGYLHRHLGCKVSCVSNFNFDFQSDKQIPDIDVAPEETAFLMSSLGIYFHVFKDFYLMIAGGYGEKKRYANINGYKCELEKNSYNGPVLEAGMLFSLGSYCLFSLSIYNIGFSSSDFTGFQMGIGLKL